MSFPMDYALLRRDPGFRPVIIDKPSFFEREDEPRIRCPLCLWEPHRSSRWSCAACPQPEGLVRGCGTHWHTFDTHGRCPGCHHQWRWTCCLACAGWSLHDEWYVEID